MCIRTLAGQQARLHTPIKGLRGARGLRGGSRLLLLQLLRDGARCGLCARGERTP